MLCFAGDVKWTAAIHDLGFITHSQHMQSRMVGLKIVSLSDDFKSITLQAPLFAGLYPPGPAWLYIMTKGVPSIGQKVLIGSGGDPPAPVLATTYTAVPQTTGTGFWASTASTTTIVIRTASVGAKCGAASGTRTVCSTPSASCRTSSGAGYSTCSPAQAPTGFARETR